MESENSDDNSLINMSTILLNTILNMLIAGAVIFLINLKDLAESLNESLTKIPIVTDPHIRFLEEYYGVSIAALFLCYVFVQLVNGEGTTKQLILYFEKLLPYNLLVTAFLLSLLMYPHFAGSYLNPFMTISIILNIVIPAVFSVFFCLFLLYQRFLLIITKLNQGRSEHEE